MTTISAQIVCDSISPHGVRLTTFQCVYPRWIHAEIMTHRAFCRNASSNRAIPQGKVVKGILDDPAFPLHLGRNEKGMQANSQIQDQHRANVYGILQQALDVAVRSSTDLYTQYDLHKQVCNRLTEPFQHISVVLSATEFENFFALRCHDMAEPHVMALAWILADAYYNTAPRPLTAGEWHLPYIRAEEHDVYDIGSLKKFSAARCARVSYNLHDGEATSPEKDLELYAKLVAGLEGPDPLQPGHLSPFEHQATPGDNPSSYSGPLRGWKQYRKEFANENMRFDYNEAKARGWRDLALSILGKKVPSPG